MPERPFLAPQTEDLTPAGAKISKKRGLGTADWRPDPIGGIRL